MVISYSNLSPKKLLLNYKMRYNLLIRGYYVVSLIFSFP
jgi:hypothetical protein